MKQHLKSQGAFTLIEMTISITVFTIFLGFSMSTFLTFHRAQQEAATTRSMMLEMESVMTLLTEDLKTHKLDYDYYDVDKGFDTLRAPGQSLLSRLSLATSDGLMTNTLALETADGGQMIFDWDDVEEDLTVQIFDAAGDELDGYLQPINLNSVESRVSHVSFNIFPSKDPYDPINSKEDDLQYQPIVQVNMTFARPGRVRPEVQLDLQTSITSRFYQ